MVAKNPLFSSHWTLKKFRATIINDIWSEVLLFTLVSVVVVVVSKKTDVHLGISNVLLGVLGTALGLVISFRTSSAYERYQEGRKLWSNIGAASRNLAQVIWVHVPVDRRKNAVCQDQSVLEATIEKKTMINFIQAFAVAVKHFLRDEPEVFYEDLFPLLCFLPRHANPDTPHEKLPLWHTHDGFEKPSMGRHDDPIDAGGAQDMSDEKSAQSWFKTIRGNRSRRSSFDPEHVLPQVESERPLKPARNPPRAKPSDFIPLFRFFQLIGRIITCRFSSDSKTGYREHPKDCFVESNVPFEIILVLSNYSSHLLSTELVPPVVAGEVFGQLTALQNALAGLERICNTPLPFAYQAHLRMSLWFYLLFIPFQIYDVFGWLTIPGTAFSSFLLLGFLEIGQEIENPFNYDLNDLDLDHFCLSLQRELHQITAHHNPRLSEYLYAPFNQPFAPVDRRGAHELLRLGTDYHHPDKKSDPGIQSIRRTLVGSWREVDRITRRAE